MDDINLDCLPEKDPRRTPDEWNNWLYWKINDMVNCEEFFGNPDKDPLLVIQFPTEFTDILNVYNHNHPEETRNETERAAYNRYTKLLKYTQTTSKPISSTTFDLTSHKQTHQQVTEAWTNMITDPLNALTHPALFDVSNPKTAAWIEAYGQLQDHHQLNQHNYPTNPTAATEYARLVRHAKQAWDDAYTYARKTSDDWLPTEEAAAARRAIKLLRTAADETATLAERSLAAKKAAELIDSILTISLPAETVNIVLRATEKRQIAAPVSS